LATKKQLKIVERCNRGRLKENVKDPFVIIIKTTREEGLLVALRLQEIGINDFEIKEKAGEHK